MLLHLSGPTAGGFHVTHPTGSSSSRCCPSNSSKTCSSSSRLPGRLPWPQMLHLALAGYSSLKQHPHSSSCRQQSWPGPLQVALHASCQPRSPHQCWLLQVAGEGRGLARKVCKEWEDSHYVFSRNSIVKSAKTEAVFASECCLTNQGKPMQQCQLTISNISNPVL